MLEPMAPAVIESASTNATATGQPGAYCFYGEEFRLYPVPAESNWDDAHRCLDQGRSSCR
jgi:hypothetical protein